MTNLESRLESTLMTPAAKCPASRGVKPTSSRADKTIPMYYYEVLTENPYQFTYEQLNKEVHFKRRSQSHLQVDKYEMKRNELCKVWGWGIYQDKSGKLALLARESKEYRLLLADPKVRKLEALNPSSAQIEAFKNKLSKP